jgi:hypothetical protein
MNLNGLQKHVWRSLPARRLIAGRSTVNDLVQLTIEAWPADYMNAAVSDEERSIVAADIERSVKRLHHACTNVDSASYGMLWAFLLQGLVTLIVQKIIEWWLEHRANRAFLIVMKHELTK